VNPDLSSPEQLHQRLEAAEARCQELEQQLKNSSHLDGIAPSRSPTGGKKVVLFMVGTLAFSFLSALVIFVMAKKTAHHKREQFQAIAVTRVDEAGQKIALGIQTCMVDSKLQPPMEGKMRLNLTSEGGFALLEANVTPRQPELVRCVRSLPARIKLPPSADRHVAELLIETKLLHNEQGKWLSESSWKQITGTSPAHPE
jgi:hypothetical protein